MTRHEPDFDEVRDRLGRALRGAAEQTRAVAERVVPLLRGLAEAQREIEAVCAEHPWVRDAIEDAQALEDAAGEVLHRTITFASCDYSLVPNDALARLRDAADRDQAADGSPDAMRWTPED